jgi:hypothetical protein
VGGGDFPDGHSSTIAGEALTDKGKVACRKGLRLLLSPVLSYCTRLKFNPVSPSAWSQFFLAVLIFSSISFTGLHSLMAAPSFANAVKAGVINTFEITEASGLVASRQNPGVLWTHNDSGSPGTVFAISTNCDLLARYTIPGVFSGNFEDIAYGPGPNPDFQYIYLGDIGDNFVFRTSIRVFRFPEPSVYHYQVDLPHTDATLGAQELTLTYPDGPFDAEALMVDPLTGDLFIATKLTNSSRIYRATRGEMDSGNPIELTFIREISFFKPSAGDISSDGRLILLRRGGNGAAWVRQPGQSVGDALGGSSSKIPLAEEANGEAIGIHATGLGYYTLSEGLFQTNYYYRRTDSAVPRQPVVFINPGDSWRYDDTGLDQGTAWRQLNFSDTNWNVGPAQLGYGQGDEGTIISFGGDDFAKYITTYFRKTFNKASSVTVTNLAMRVCFNDGVAVYLNGTEIFRRNVATDAAYNTLALGSAGEKQNYWISAPVNPALLRTGSNVVAVEIHRFDPIGPDLSFDLQLLEGAVELPPRFTSMPRIVNNQWQIDLAGPSGSSVAIDTSNDMLTWSEAGRVLLLNGVGTFQEPANPPPTARFYRLRN